MSSKSFLDLYRAHTGYMCDKWEQYLAIYDLEIAQLVARGRPLNLLEIGVQNGGSLEIWAKLLPPGSRIVGIDIDPSCAELKFPDSVQVLVGDASNADFLRASLGDLNFDIIIDDGSHRSSEIIRSFRSLFPRLRPSGKYFIEDLHASYWSEFGGSFRGDGSAVEFLKSLVDALHTDHFGNTDGVSADELAVLIELNRQIARLGFVDSLAVIEKFPREKDQPFVRTIAGSAVESSNKTWRSHLISWSPPLMLFDNDVRTAVDADTRQELARLGSKAAQLNDEVARLERAQTESDIERRRLEERLREQEKRLATAHSALMDVRERRNQLRVRLKTIKGSWSWRLSFPLRRLERLLRHTGERPSN